MLIRNVKPQCRVLFNFVPVDSISSTGSVLFKSHVSSLFASQKTFILHTRLINVVLEKGRQHFDHDSNETVD